MRSVTGIPSVPRALAAWGIWRRVAKSGQEVGRVGLKQLQEAFKDDLLFPPHLCVGCLFLALHLCSSLLLRRLLRQQLILNLTPQISHLSYTGCARMVASGSRWFPGRAAIVTCSEGAQFVRVGGGAAIVICSHVMSCHVMLSRVVSRHVALCLVALCRVMLVKSGAAALPTNASLKFTQLILTPRILTPLMLTQLRLTYTTHFHTTQSLTTHLMRSRSVVLHPRLPPFRLPIQVFDLNFRCGVIRSFFMFLF